jgi:hypothetical protein
LCMVEKLGTVGHGMVQSGEGGYTTRRPLPTLLCYGSGGDGFRRELQLAALAVPHTRYKL